MKEDAIKCKNVSLLSLNKTKKQKNSVHKTLNYTLMNTIHISPSPSQHPLTAKSKTNTFFGPSWMSKQKKTHINYNAKLTDPLQKNGKDHVQHTL